MQIHKLESNLYTEYFLTLPATESDSPTCHFNKLADFIIDNGVQPIQEKVYGRISAREQIIKCREQCYKEKGLDTGLPFTFIQGQPVHKGDFAGIQLWGISPSVAGTKIVETITCAQNKTAIARVWQDNNARFAYFPFIQGLDSEGNLPSGPTAQAEQMFKNVHSRLENCSFSLRQVLRTWIYMAKILDWYDEFNNVRSTFFKKYGLIRGKEDDYMPASTGIQGRSNLEDCFLDMLTVDTKNSSDIKLNILKNTLQNEAFAYGSAFSRGIALEKKGKNTIFVSGTASIDDMGRTVRIADYEGQALQTLMAIAALIKPVGAKLENISLATVFCKDLGAWKAYQRCMNLLQIPEFPIIPVIADVCRSDLLIEIEAIAVC
ncbi:Rid family hydrolase [Candidatus Riflebacteria bacterium]